MTWPSLWNNESRSTETRMQITPGLNEKPRKAASDVRRTWVLSPSKTMAGMVPLWMRCRVCALQRSRRGAGLAGS